MGGWEGGRGGFNNTSELTELKLGWLDEQNAVSWDDDDDDGFQYLTFELLVLPWMMLIMAVFSPPPQHVAAGSGTLS